MGFWSVLFFPGSILFTMFPLSRPGTTWPPCRPPKNLPRAVSVPMIAPTKGWVMCGKAVLSLSYYIQGIVGCTPTNVPLGENPYISPIWWGFVGYNPQESLENTINTTGTLLGLHPSLSLDYYDWRCEKKHPPIFTSWVVAGASILDVYHVEGKWCWPRTSEIFDTLIQVESN